MSAEQVRAYYDSNTAGFLRFGHSGEVGAIHRAVWGPGVQTRAEALQFAEAQIMEFLGPSTSRVLDLGCGVGASLAHMASRRTFEGVGVSISGVQVELANKRFRAAGLAERLKCVEADFTALPDSLGVFDAAYAIEAFLHAPSAEAFFREVVRVMQPGGTLVLVDDFLDPRAESGQLNRREARWIEEFKRGWHADGLMSFERASVLADEAGFDLMETRDFTSDIELRRPRDRLITAMVRVGRHLPINHPWWMNLLGGNALQMALVRRLLRYRLVAFRRR